MDLDAPSYRLLCSRLHARITGIAAEENDGARLAKAVKTIDAVSSVRKHSGVRLFFRATQPAIDIFQIAIHVAAITLAVCVAYAYSETLSWPLVHDAPLMHYIAQRTLEGTVPYLQLFDMNMPGTYLLHMFCLIVFGESDFAFRMFDLFWLAITMIAIAAFCRRIGLLAVLVSATLFASYHLAISNLSLAQRDFLLCPFVLLSAHLFCCYLERGSLWRIGGAGAMLGCAVCVKPFIGFLGLLYLPSLVDRAHLKKSIVALAVFAFSGWIPLLAIFSWLQYIGANGAFREVVFDYLIPIYSAVGSNSLTRCTDELLRFIAIFIPFVLVPWTIKKDVEHYWRMVFFGIVAGGLHYFLQRKTWAYHLYPLALFLSICSGSAIASFCRASPEGTMSRSLRAVSVTLIFFGFLTFTKFFALSRLSTQTKKLEQVSRLAEDIRKNIEPGDMVQVMDTTWGAINALYRLNVKLPTRFMYDFPFFTRPEEKIVTRFRTEFVEVLKSRKPKLLVVIAEAWPDNTAGKGRVLQIPGLMNLLDNYYEVAVDVPEYIIYRHK